jgi:hypothetical protein
MTIGIGNKVGVMMKAWGNGKKQKRKNKAPNQPSIFHNSNVLRAPPAVKHFFCEAPLPLQAGLWGYLLVKCLAGSSFPSGVRSLFFVEKLSSLRYDVPLKEAGIIGPTLLSEVSRGDRRFREAGQPGQNHC